MKSIIVVIEIHPPILAFEKEGDLMAGRDEGREREGEGGRIDGKEGEGEGGRIDGREG